MSRITERRDTGVVHLDPGAPIEAVLKRFKNSCIAAGIFNELSKRRYFMPPGFRRREKARKTAQRRARAARRLLENGPPDDWKPTPAPRA